MKISTFIASGACALALLSPTSIAQSYAAQSAYGIEVPVRGATEEPTGKVDAPKLDKSTGIDVVEADNLSDAASGAAQQAADPQPTKGQSKFRKIEGTSFFQDRSGKAGLMVTGVAAYETNFANPDAARLARRGAYVRAHADAMRKLTEKVYGGDVERQLAIVNKVINGKTGDMSLETEENQTKENIQAASSGLIRGAQTFKCEDEGGRVRIWLFVTNDSATGNRHVNSATKVASAREFQAALDSIMDEILSGFLPPIGGKVVHCPETGQATYVGFGSSIILNTRLGEDTAQRKAELRAKAGLVGCISGTQVDYSEYLQGEELNIASDFRSFGETLPPAEGDEQLVEGFTAAIAQTEKFGEAITQVTKGKLPAATMGTSFVDEENGWLTTVYFYTVGAENLVEGLRGDAKFNGDQSSKNKPKPKYGDKRGPSGQGKDPRGGGQQAIAPPTDFGVNPDSAPLVAPEGSNRRTQS